MPTDPPWRPLWERVAGETGEHELVEDVPDYLGPPLQEWMRYCLENFDGLETSIQLRLRRTLKIGRLSNTRRAVFAEGKDLLEMIDAALHIHSWLCVKNALMDEWMEKLRDKWLLQVGTLQVHLHEAGSTWTVDEERAGLERRVDETVVEAAQATIATAPPDASVHLRAAWSAAYGFQPDPGKAYSQAIKAAEAVVIPATIPNAGTPTLGTALKHMEDTAAKWTMVLADKTGNPASAEPVIGLIRMLWQGQRDRHAGGPTSKPTTQEAAEAAVHAAVLIVQWFNSRAVVKNP